MERRLSEYYNLIHQRPQLFAESELIAIETDERAILEYEKSTGCKIGVIYQSPYSILLVDLIKRADGGYYTYERVIPTVPKGAVVALTKCNNQYVLLRQYRHTIRDYQYACPRGFGEESLSIEENLQKEIEEEVHAKLLCYEHLGSVVADSGLCSNTVDVFLCEVDSVKIEHGYEGIENVVLLNEDEMEEWIRRGKITDGFTLSAYAFYRTGKNDEK